MALATKMTIERADPTRRSRAMTGEIPGRREGGKERRSASALNSKMRESEELSSS